MTGGWGWHGKLVGSGKGQAGYYRLRLRLRLRKVREREGERSKKLGPTASFLKNGGLILDGGNDPKKSGGFGWVGPVGAG